MPDALLVGNNLAVLVAAAELGAAGAEVVLVTDGRPAGGHFRGVHLDGHDFDLGMVLLESAPLPAPAEGSSPGPAGYRPRDRYDWTRFAALVDRWQDGLVRRVRVPTPEVLVEGRRWPDHLVANRLDVLAAGGFTPPAPLPRDDPRHAAGKLAAPLYDDLRYTDAAAANHGSSIHGRLVEPFARKLLGDGYEVLLARHHRAGWLPLYWPETLAAACEGRPTGLAEYPFWTTASGFVGELVRVLGHRLQELPCVHVSGAPVDLLRQRTGTWEVGTTDGGRWSHPRPVLGVAPDRARDLLDLPSGPRTIGASVVMVCCLVRGSAIGAPAGCLSVVDPGFTTYRITDQDALAGLDPEWHRVVLEAGPQAADRAQAGEDVPDALLGELALLLDLASGTARDDVRALRTVVARGAVPVPTAASVASDDAASDGLAAAVPSGLLTGALLGAGVTSVNDQVVQGLGVAERLA